MKPFRYLLVFLITTLFLIGPVVSSIADTKKKSVKKRERVRSTKKLHRSKVPPDKKILLIRSAEIVSLRIGTDADGTWTWTAEVKNTGNSSIAKNSMSVQGFQHSSSNQISAASGSILPKNLGVGQKVKVRRRWTRCCDASTLNVKLFDNLPSPSTVIDQATIPVLDYHLKVAKLTWNRASKEWTATVKNMSKMTMKITVQGVATHASPISWTGAGGYTRIIPPRGKITQKGHWLSYQPNDRLKVELRCLDGGWCGPPGWSIIDHKEIILP